MIDPLATSLILLALLGVCWSVVLVVRNRRMDNPLVYGLGLLEVGLLVQTAAGVYALTDTARPVDGATFVGYLLTSVLVLPVAVVWSASERSRWGTAVLTAGCLVVAVMVLRLQQIWAAGGA